MSIFEGERSTWLLAAGMAVMIWVLLRRSHRYFGPRTPNHQAGAVTARSTSEDSTSRSPLLDAPPALTRWHVEMHETARTMKAELDNRIGVLQQLVIQSNQQIESLDAAIRRAEALGLPAGHDTLDDLCRATAEPVSVDPDGEIQLPIGDLAQVAAGGPDQADSPARQQRIYELADQGQPAATIAAQIGAPVGDVEFALSLRSR